MHSASFRCSRALFRGFIGCCCLMMSQTISVLVSGPISKLMYWAPFITEGSFSDVSFGSRPHFI